ncbi:MAG: ATP-dependent helicase, partial [Chthoniobacter sp.]|nr:ATP-dependent helicase [Chthoniobacter sp.]
MSALESIFKTELVRSAARDVDARILEREVNPTASDDPQAIAVDELRVAAIASLIDYLGDKTVDGMMRNGATSAVLADSEADECLCNWQAYMNGLVELDARPTADDLLFFTVAGFLACKPHEVRHALRRPKYRTWLDQAREALPKLTWIDRVRSYVTIG